MECEHLTSGQCHSCPLMPTPYDLQLARRQSTVKKILAGIPHAPTMQWLPPAASTPSHYRTKAKFAIGGTAEHPTLGITGPAPAYEGVDLPHCIAHTDVIARSIEPLKEFIRSTGIEPYDIAKRTGELKQILVTQGSAEALMIRFVLRSKRELAKLRSRLPLLQSLIPTLQVVTVNILPIHAALVEGDEEIVISEQTTLPMLVGDVELHLGPRSFSQTNTGVASELYRQVAQWARDSGVTSLWDLYCGVGGFALHAALGGVKRVSGVEISPEAIASAQRTAADAEVSDRVTFMAADAAQWAFEQGLDACPQAIVVNPPRRGIGGAFAEWINDSRASYVIYSSCNPKSLASDLKRMPNYAPLQARLFDMFPHTEHMECALLLEKLP